jgi:hypothetical protein
MVFRATFVAVRVATFLAAFLLFLFGRLFLPGAVLGPPAGGEEATRIAGGLTYSICAGFATFLALFGVWTYRVQRLVVRLSAARLLFIRLVVAFLSVTASLVIVACLAWTGFARILLSVGAVLSAVGLAAAILAKGPGLRRRAPSRQRAY